MSKNNWKKFCVVGLGKHAIQKIIPSLINAEKKIIGIVSSQNKNKYSQFKCFKTVEDAIEYLPEDTVYILSTPPEIHNIQISKILNHGRDIIVEKPAFIKVEDIINARKSKNFKNNIIFEGFMHRYTILYKYFIDFWSKNSNQVFELNSNFFIPEVPQNSFRQSNVLTSSCLYDMGCYGVSLINDIGFNIRDLQISDFVSSKKKLISFKIVGKINNIEVNINCGYADKYLNNVEIINVNKESINFYPFYKGTKEKKFIEIIKDSQREVKEISDCNGFEEMYKQDRGKLLENQKLRFERMTSVTEQLNIFEKQIKEFLK